MAIVLACLMGFAPIVNAANTPGFDLKKFQALINLAAAKGDIVKGSDYEYHSLSHIDPADPKKPHQADYFTDVGVTDSHGSFGTMEVSIVSEDWTQNPDGNWVIDQWDWTSETDGNLLSVDHTILVETSEGLVVSVKGIPVGAINDPAEVQHWQNQLVKWYAFENDL